MKTTGTDQSIVGMSGGQRGSSLCGQLIQLRCRDALVDAHADLLSDQHGVAELGVEAITELLQTGGDLIEVHGFLTPIALDDIHGEDATSQRTGVSHGVAAEKGVEGRRSEGPTGQENPRLREEAQILVTAHVPNDWNLRFLKVCFLGAG